MSDRVTCVEGADLDQEATFMSPPIATIGRVALPSKLEGINAMHGTTNSSKGAA